MGRRLAPNSDAWGGSWCCASAWGGSWGWSWGPLHQVEEHPEYYGGGRRSSRPVEDEAQLHRDHWEYMDRLRESRAKAEPEPVPVAVQAEKPPAPKVEARAMRGTVKAEPKPPTLAEMLGDPLILASLAVAIEEAD